MKKILFAGILMVTIALALASPLRAYVLYKMIATDTGAIVPRKWATSAFPITWQMNPTLGVNVTGSRTQAAVIAASFATWQALTTASVSFTQGANVPLTTKSPAADGLNTISTSAADAVNIGSGVIAQTFTFAYTTTGSNAFAGQIAEADMIFSSVLPFTTEPAAVAASIDMQAVATHEVGHFLGLDHSPMISATMFWAQAKGVTYPRTLTADDMAGISLLYPVASAPAKGTLSGTIRTTAGVPVYGAAVVAVNASGSPVASTISDPSGAYTIQGLDAGSYTVYAEPLDGPVLIGNIYSFDPTSANTIYPGATVNTSFTTRFR